MKFMQEPLMERVSGAATVGGIITTASVTIADVNLYLQAGAYIVAMLSGIAATIYYFRRSK